MRKGMVGIEQSFWGEICLGFALEKLFLDIFYESVFFVNVDSWN